jgi:hypothetical protein
MNDTNTTSNTASSFTQCGYPYDTVVTVYNSDIWFELDSNTVRHESVGQFMTTAEARQLAANLLRCADMAESNDLKE